jgi:glutamine amidotransferase
MAVRVAVIDYGMGNIGSICKMLRVVGADPVVTSDPGQLASADKLVLPGVGHFDRAMQNLSAARLVDELAELVVTRQTPILGVCLGMQLLCGSSEEGGLPGLGYVDAQVRRFTPEDGRKVPHMGWSQLEVARPSPLLEGLDDESRFYFVHSYFVDCANDADVIARSSYGHSFVAAFERGNVQGVQFHPEKSHRFGKQVFRNFVEN